MLSPMLVAANETDTASASVHEAAVMKEAENPRCQWSGVGGSVLRGKQGGKTGRVMEKTGMKQIATRAQEQERVASGFGSPGWNQRN